MPTRRHLMLHLLSLAVAVVLGLALLEPVPPPVEAATQGYGFPIDKLAHFGLFLVAALFWRRSFSALGLRAPGIAAVVTAAVYGGLLEIAQGLWTARDANLLDMVAGALGALVAVSVVRPRGRED